MDFLCFAEYVEVFNGKRREMIYNQEKEKQP